MSTKNISFSTGEDFGVGKRCVGFKGGRSGGFVFKDAWKTLHLKPETGLTFSNMVSIIYPNIPSINAE